MSFSLEIAERIAQALVDRLRPYCGRIEIAGSIRRRRPQVKDIDLVVIPRFTSRWSMFAPKQVVHTDFAEDLVDLFGETRCCGEKIISGILDISRLDPEDAALGTIQADVYIATAETWATLLLIRTGSAAHNIWLCQRARELGGKLFANGEGLELAPARGDLRGEQVSGRILPTSEEAIFAALELSFIPPERRECDREGSPIWAKATRGEHS